MARSWSVFGAVAAIVVVVIVWASAGGARGAVQDVYEPDALNASPITSDTRRIRVRGILRLYALSDGPYLFQDMNAYALKSQPEHMVTVSRSSRIVWYRERYEAARVVITGDYRRSSCREPGAACPHLKNELDPIAIEIVDYPDKSAAEAHAESGRQPLHAVATDDRHWQEIADMAQRLARAVRQRDLKTIRALIDPGSNAASGPPRDPRWLDETLAPGGRVYWRLFDPESSFVSEQNPRPVFRAYEINDQAYRDEQRSIAICYDRGIRSNWTWPDSQFDFETANVGDPYACVRAFKGAGGWWLDI